MPEVTLTLSVKQLSRAKAAILRRNPGSKEKGADLLRDYIKNKIGIMVESDARDEEELKIVIEEF